MTERGLRTLDKDLENAEKELNRLRGIVNLLDGAFLITSFNEDGTPKKYQKIQIMEETSNES